jgi:hypothetical protein
MAILIKELAKIQSKYVIHSTELKFKNSIKQWLRDKLYAEFDKSFLSKQNEFGEVFLGEIVYKERIIKEKSEEYFLIELRYIGKVFTKVILEPNTELKIDVDNLSAIPIQVH